MVYIYVLQLEEGKYYIGKTTNPQFRLEQHFNSSGSQWTKKYTPKKVLQIIPNCDNFDEDKYTLQYMEQYGINNVRGGSFCELKLDKDHLSTIKKMINGSSDKCYICGETGHFANDCKQDDDDNMLEEFENLYCNKKNKKTTKNTCDICGREGHTSSDCYAKTTINGDIIEEIERFCCSYCNKEFTSIKGLTCHENLYCNKKNKNKNTCSTCGREGHTSSDCYAKTTINGDIIEEIELFSCSYCYKKFDSLKGVTCHENLYCKNKNKNKKTTKNTCDICGKVGHKTINCYAF
jgi:hypothetical protein